MNGNPWRAPSAAEDMPKPKSAPQKPELMGGTYHDAGPIAEQTLLAMRANGAPANASIDLAGDTFEIRRANGRGAGVPYDPDSLLTGEDVEAGLGYEDARDRGADWEHQDSLWQRAIRGEFSQEQIVELFPRRAGLTY